jgi:DNA-binding phage protein
MRRRGVASIKRETTMTNTQINKALSDAELDTVVGGSVTLKSILGDVRSLAQDVHPQNFVFLRTDLGFLAHDTVSLIKAHF